MKMTSKFKSFFAVAAACLLAACNTPEEQINEIEVSSPDVSITKLGVGADNSAVTVEITSNTYWRAFIEEGCDWLAVSPMGGPAGTTVVEIVASSNLDGEQRSADITIEAEDDTKQIIHVTQGGQGDFVYIIEDSFGEGRDEDTDIASVTTTATGVGVSDFFYSADGAFLSKENPSSGYEGATGGANLLIKAGGSVVLNRIGTDFTLQFRLHWGLLAGESLPELYASADGESWGYIPYVTSGSGDWVAASTKLDFRDNAAYRFFKIANPSSEDCRIDDFILEDAAFSAGDFTNVTAAPGFAGSSWNEGDMLAVFCGERPLQFSYTGEGNIFSTIYDMAEVPEYYALYPYDGSATISGSTISTTLRAEQTYSPGSSFNVNAPMV
ncbi:MAG: hypothetical protein MJY56_03805, partial [Bacteroidales bacterium]|nr:hypothetical protein [Bacteroidales bacterium]